MVLGTRWLVPIHKEVYETVHQYNASPKQLKKDHGGEIIESKLTIQRKPLSPRTSFIFAIGEVLGQI